MSRIGKQPIKIPEKIEVRKEGGFVIINGPKGESRQLLSPDIKMEIKDNEIIFSPARPLSDSSGLRRKKIIAVWGTMRAIVANMIRGVTEGFEKKLELHGVGYRAAVEGRKLILNLGFSHPVFVEAPDGIDFKVEKNIIIISGIDNQLVGQVAAKIRSKRKPEPYKGKGVRYSGEIVRRKAGKKAAAK